MSTSFKDRAAVGDSDKCDDKTILRFRAMVRAKIKVRKWLKRALAARDARLRKGKGGPALEPAEDKPRSALDDALSVASAISTEMYDSDDELDFSLTEDSFSSPKSTEKEKKKVL